MREEHAGGLTAAQFKVLAACGADGEGFTQRELAVRTGLSLGSVNRTCKELEAMGLTVGGVITPAGYDALLPYKVDNAVILAAGLSSRFAPISYEKPKGLMVVRGEVLIERQIRQLREAGIGDIVVVVGYKKEYFFYLEEKFGVSLVVNDEYASRNNHSSLMRVRERLGNTYICSSDDYFTENVFEPYVYEAYYASVFHEGPTDEWCLATGPGGRIVRVSVGGCDAPIMLGHVYFDRSFSDRFARILEDEYDLPQTAGKLWEELFVDHIKELHMVAREYDQGIIWEFDSLDDARAFDPEFIVNVDSEALDNIVSVLGCERADIADFVPIKQGITNLSCRFRAGDRRYVYRHPGVGTEQLINREYEERASSIARDLGLDDTFVYEDPARGWKISRYIERCRTLDVHDLGDVRCAMEALRRLHDSGRSIDHGFDFYEEGVRYCGLLGSERCESVPGFADMRRRVDALRDAFLQDEAPCCLCHNDFFHLNMLFDADGTFSLIDWEYAGMADYSQDFGTFVVCSEMDEALADAALELYFGRKPTFEERRHNFASVAFAGWCWYVWSLFKEAQGEFVGEPFYVYYRYAKEYVGKASELYGLA